MLQQAVQHHQLGRVPEAEKLYRQVITLSPNQPDAHNLLGVIAHQTGRLDYAVDLMRRAITLNPDDANFHFNLANALFAKGALKESAAEYRRVLSLNPAHAAAANGLGLALRNTGDVNGSVKAFEDAARLNPNFWDAVFNLGCAYEQCDRLELAIGCYERALELKPGSTLALNNLGNAKQQAGRYAEAEADILRALELDPKAAVAHVNLGVIQLAQDKMEPSIQSFRHAIELNPGLAEAHNNLARALQGKLEYDERVRSCERAIALRPDYVGAMVNLGCALREQGQTAEAMQWFRRAAAIAPADKDAQDNIQFSMILLPDYDMEAISSANRDFWLNRPADEFGSIAHRNSPDPEKRVRLGYVSGDFRRHPAAYFIEPILSHHDRQNFEIFCYSSNSREDEFTARFKDLAEHWRSIAKMKDAELAAAVVNDEIDILVDLAGHTAHNRLTAFERGPAPVQVTYLGYPATTGLAAIDYRLTDAIADPPGDGDRHYIEKLWRLPDALVCYHPPADMPDAGELPAMSNGYVTFGSFNGVSKVGPEVVALWARILKSAPGSRLIVTTIPAGHAQTRMLELFAKCGIEASRLQMFEMLSNAEFLSLYQRVDISLDPFPCNGGTSTCESLWMGVPVVCLRGDTFAGRVAPSMLAASGHAEWAAASRQEYVGIALRLASDLNGLAAIRAGLRSQAQNSPLGNAEKFTRGLEQAFRAMWAKWCAANPVAN